MNLRSKVCIVYKTTIFTTKHELVNGFTKINYKISLETNIVCECYVLNVKVCIN